MQNKPSSLTAMTLRNILMGTIALLVVLSIGGFVFAQKQLSATAADVNTSSNQAAATEQDLAQLQRLKTEMEDSKVAVTRAASVVADSKSYQYQDQIINDLSVYARTAGFQIESFTFADPMPKAGNPAAPGMVAPSGLKVSTVTVALPDSLPYERVMRFLKSIEQNLTKMEVTGVNFAVDQATKKISVQPIVIGVYTR